MADSQRGQKERLSLPCDIKNILAQEYNVYECMQWAYAMRDLLVVLFCQTALFVARKTHVASFWGWSTPW